MKILGNSEHKHALTHMERAAEIARESLCLRARCGTVIIKDGKEIGRGYNAPPQDDVESRRCLLKHELAPTLKSDKTCCVHAEQRAVMDALTHNPEDLSGSQLYFTRVDDEGEILLSGKPYCTICSKMALDAGIAEFILWHEEGITVYDTHEYNELSFASK